MKIESAQMDIKILLLVLCITFASVQGAIPRCCTGTAPVRKKLLQRVEKFTIQNRYGLCDIDALVLHIHGKKFCAPMRQRTALEKMNLTLTGQKNF